MIASVLDIPGHGHDIDPVAQFILDQSSWPSRCVPQIDPYYLCVLHVRRKSYRGQDEGDANIAQKVWVLDAMCTSSTVEDSCPGLDGQK